jgi:hypothetical protein
MINDVALEPSPAVAESLDIGFYVYAVVRPREGQAGGALPMEGIIPDVKVEAFSYKDVRVIYSEVPLSIFGQAALEQYLQEANWVRDRVMAQQTLLTRLLRDYTVLPFKFCTVYLNKDGILATLDNNYASFDRALRDLAGATEWGVKVYCDLAIFAKQVEQTSEALRAQREALERAKPGTAYFLRKKLDQAALREAETAITWRVQEIHTRLTQRARRALLNKVQTASEHGHSDAMFMNAAYLVPDADWPAFRTMLDDMTPALAKQGITLELTGPWPPYNFASDGSAEPQNG